MGLQNGRGAEVSPQSHMHDCILSLPHCFCLATLYKYWLCTRISARLLIRTAFTMGHEHDQIASKLSALQILNVSKPQHPNELESRDDLAAAVVDLLARCNVLLSELDAFTDYLAERKLNTVPFRHFRTSIL